MSKCNSWRNSFKEVAVEQVLLVLLPALLGSAFLLWVGLLLYLLVCLRPDPRPR